MKNPKVRKSARDPLDDQVTVETVRFLDTGHYFKRKAAEHRYVQIDLDVYKDFSTAKEVNDALRFVQRTRKLESTRRKKSA